MEFEADSAMFGVAEAVWSIDSNQPELLKLARKYFRNAIFMPFIIFKEMDLAGGTLHTRVLTFCAVETSGLRRFRASGNANLWFILLNIIT
jgi:hypothetical protein